MKLHQVQQALDVPGRAEALELMSDAKKGLPVKYSLKLLERGKDHHV